MNASPPERRNQIHTIGYGLYAWLVFVLGLSAAVLGVSLLPGLDRRRRWASRCARSFFSMAGIRSTRLGTEHLPPSASVVVANHASYLDGVILQAFLPSRYAYVIKNEMQKVPLAHFFLRRIGAHFVERFRKAAGARDARRLMRDADGGASLAFFPEGTFIAQPGLGKFYLGAFMTAKRSALPIVPVVISGSRFILPAGRMLPRRGDLTIEVLPPLSSDEAIFDSPRALADATRRRMLTVLAEPDLSAGDTP